MTSITAICPACGITFAARSVLAVYCTVTCKCRAAYYRRQGRPIPTTKQTFNRPQPIRPKVLQPEILQPDAAWTASPAGTEERIWQGTAIQRREADGFVNATQMAKANGKHLPHYMANDRTREYLQALAPVVGIPTTELIHTIQGGTPALQGTWIHPRLAIDLARWISPAFAVWMDGWFLETIAQPAPSPAAAPLKPGVHVVAESRREACRLWKEAIQSEVQGAIDRALGWKHCSEQTLPLAVNYNVTTTA